MWIPSVGLPADVAIAERIATSEKVLPRSNATLSRPEWPPRYGSCHDPVPRRDKDLLVGTQQAASLRSLTEGDTFVAVS
ncbi:hypothetical protein Taro_020986 [Colocasia esculenta]|uniref:Uncharacterized protein n=1 Tax=Colocasia esculenta TaxID=4460 RepID=A0A843VA43_COLES|nr:hypothetical protein [Colocasia esculenta]